MSTFITLNSIADSWLLKREYPDHWYLIALKHATDCVRNLRITSLPIVKTAVLTVNEYGAIDYPVDYSSMVRLGVRNGQFVIPLVQSRGSMNRVPNRDANGQEVPYGTPSVRTNAYMWMVNWYNTGLYRGVNSTNFGHGAGYESDLFQEFPERQQIQISEEMIGKTVVLDYIPDLNSCDHLTQIPAFAQPCIEQWITWQIKENNRSYSKGECKDEERMFNKQRDILRAQIEPLGKEDILRIFRRGYHSGQKA